MGRLSLTQPWDLWVAIGGFLGFLSLCFFHLAKGHISKLPLCLSHRVLINGKQKAFMKCKPLCVCNPHPLLEVVKPGGVWCLSSDLRAPAARGCLGCMVAAAGLGALVFQVVLETLEATCQTRAPW